MFKRLSTDTVNTILIIGFILLLIEIAFFNGGLIFSVFFSGLLTYIGWKSYGRLWAKIFFWVGTISLMIAILNMIAVRFLLLAGIVLFFMNYYRSKNDPERITPQLFPEEESMDQEPLIKVDPLFRLKFFGDQKTSESVYQWRDINIHGGYGNRIIDLSNTVLPDEAIISIRHFVGNIEIYIPYEVEVSILHSSIIGRANILGNEQVKLLNQSFLYQTENYERNKPRVKIITSILSGNIEVKRI